MLAFGGGNPAPVIRTLTLLDKSQVTNFVAVVKEYATEPKYNSAGCADYKVAEWLVTVVKAASTLGQTLMTCKLGSVIILNSNDMLVVNIDGGVIQSHSDWEKTKEELQEWQAQQERLREQQVEQRRWAGVERRLSDIKISFAKDRDWLKEFPEMGRINEKDK